MYSRDQQQIRQGLTNFIGALLDSSRLESRAAKQDINAIILEESLALCQDKNGIYDLKIAKPLLKAVILLFKQRINELKSVEDTGYYIKCYQTLIDEIESLLKSL